MQVFRKQYKIYIDRTPAETWEFFFDLRNQWLLLPQPVPADTLTLPSLVGTGAVFTIRVRRPGIAWKIDGEVSVIEAQSLFECRQVAGPFETAAYRWISAPFQKGTLITEQLEYGLRPGLGGRLLNHFWLEDSMDSLFLFRQQEAKRIIESTPRTENTSE